MQYNPKEYATWKEISFLNELDNLLVKDQLTKEAYSNLKTLFYEILREKNREKGERENAS